MKLLYVCLGNRFRSLLAEAYTRKHTDHEVRSRGTEATGPIHEEVKQILLENDLMDYASMNPTQLESEDLEWADRTVFMSRENMEYARKELGFTGEADIWEIPDADPGDPLEKIFDDLKERIDEEF